MRRQANFSYIFQIDTAISSLFYTYLCIYHTYLCASRLPSALFNYRLCCHIDIEKGVGHRVVQPPFARSTVPLRRYLLHDSAIDRLALREEFVFVIGPRPHPLNIHLH